MRQFLINMQWGAIVIMLCFILFDLISGLAKAWKEGNIKSGVMFDGLMRKSAIIGVVILAILCEIAMTYFPLPFDVPLVLPVCAFLILMEVSSILENLTAINPELKNNKLLSMFQKQERGGDDD